MSYALTPSEQADFQKHGYLLRHAAFSSAEIGQIADDCEALFEDIKDKYPNEKMAFGNYLLERREELGTTTKWEPHHPDLIQGIEPFVHLSDPLRRLSEDRRLVEPFRDIVGGEVTLFTEKINYKRARMGGDYILHQDWPYWEPMNPQAKRVATVMILLDDATVDNGCLEVVPGSHLEPDPPRWSIAGAGRDKEIDIDRFDMTRLRPVEAPGGTLIMFGASLIHRSAPNRTDHDRRVLLFSYQPAGLPHALQIKRRWAAARQASQGQRLR